MSYIFDQTTAFICFQRSNARDIRHTHMHMSVTNLFF